MELQKVLEERCSVREYDKTKKVKKEDIEAMIAAAIQAPSWKNSQTARYYCILSEDVCKDFAAKCLPEFNAKKVEGAALIVTTFVKDRAGFAKETCEPDNEVGNGWGFYDLGLHNENLMLKARELGLDTLVMGLRDADAIRNMLAIPETETIVSVIGVGYRVSNPIKPKRKSVEDIAKFF